jgi:hypothetical protein
VSPDTWSADNLPDGYSTEEQLVNYVAGYRVQKHIVPSLTRDGLIYESYRLVDSGNKTGSWEMYSCEITTRHSVYSDFTFVISFTVHGGYYADCVVSGDTSVYYTKVVVYYNGRKFKIAERMNDAQLENYIDHFFD